MQLTITLADREVQQLQQMLERHRVFETKQFTLEDVIHECIRMAMYEESEEGA